MLIPVSWLESFSYCKRKWYLENVLGIAKPPKEAILKGSIKHSVLDGLRRCEEGLICSLEAGFGMAELLSLYELKLNELLRREIFQNRKTVESLRLDPVSLYRELLDRLRKETKMRADYVYGFAQASGLWGRALWEALTPKLLSEVKLESKDLGMKGRLDMIEKHGSVMIPIEIKTGSMPRSGVWRGHRLQLGAYGMLIESCFGCDVEHGFVWYIDHGERRKVILNEFLRREVIESISEMNELLVSKRVPGRIGGKRCLSCSLRKSCELIRRKI